MQWPILLSEKSTNIPVNKYKNFEQLFLGLEIWFSRKIIKKTEINTNDGIKIKMRYIRNNVIKLYILYKIGCLNFNL